jgi:hypothetical protein
MPFICERTGEVVPHFEADDGAEVRCETDKSLVTSTVTFARSAKTGNVERWHWKQDHELTPPERDRVSHKAYYSHA